MDAHATQHTQQDESDLSPAIAPGRLGHPVAGAPHRIGEGFSARHFSEEMFGGLMDPLLMVDHFVMTAPTFAPHLHAGISAVTAMFEDAQGGFLNRDSLGNNLALQPGDLYWLAAASGAAHEERPEDGARTHALQIFVNMPAGLKTQPARALHVQAGEVPVLQAAGHRVRVVLGRSGEAAGRQSAHAEMTMLDGFICKGGGRFAHRLAEGHQAWIYAAAGALAITAGDEARRLADGHALAVRAGGPLDITLASGAAAHFVLLSGRPVREHFVKHGPLVMSSADDVRRTLSSYAAGKLGRIPG